MTDKAMIYVVDDDPAIREALRSLLRSVGHPVETFGSAPEFLLRKPVDAPGCLILDVRLPGLSGLELQRELGEADVRIPIIFISGHGDIPISVRAIKAGAVDFLSKPFRDRQLLDAIREALERDRAERAERAEKRALHQCFDMLTPREREVMGLVVSGRPNKQIAAELGISEITVKIHRGQVMRKMQAGSLAALVQMAAKIPALSSRPIPTYS
jgi:RNA polymerase sigma factor (sigma-70 family)